MEDFELVLKLRNNQLKERRVGLGLTTRECAEKIGISYCRYVKYENMKLSPMGTGDNLTTWRPTALKVAEFYGESVDELWPNTVLSVVDPEITRKIDGDLALALAAGVTRQLAAPADARLDELERSSAISGALKQLTPMEEGVIRRRFGLDDQPCESTRQIADTYGVSSTRIIQVEHAAMYKLHSRKLREPLDEFAFDGHGHIAFRPSIYASASQ